MDSPGNTELPGPLHALSTCFNRSSVQVLSAPAPVDFSTILFLLSDETRFTDAYLSPSSIHDGGEDCLESIMLNQHALSYNMSLSRMAVVVVFTLFPLK